MQTQQPNPMKEEEEKKKKNTQEMLQYKNEKASHCDDVNRDQWELFW